MKRLVIIFCFLLSTNTLADDVTELYLSAGACWLHERGVAVKKDPISIQGFKKEDGCRAFIEDKVFNKRYKFCVYSGFQISSAPDAGWYGCAYSREKDSFMFEARLDKEKPSSEDINCKFMCFLK